MDTPLTESNRRLYEKLTRDLGAMVMDALANPDINEVMLNPDGSLWLDSHTKGMHQAGFMPRVQATAIVNTVAGIHELVLSRDKPHLEAELPFYGAVLKGQRLTAQVPPVVDAPTFTIRKKSEVVYTLDDYIATDRLMPDQAEQLRELVKQRANILICGGPGSGKTTVTNALILEAVKSAPAQRFLILEDLPELQCSAENTVHMFTCESVNTRGLLRAAMRMRPDRILIGEVRGAEALDMLKAWNTGCPGGICTVHANGVEEAIQRILDLAMEAGLTNAPYALVNHTIDAVVSVKRQGNQKGFIEKIQLRGEKWL